MFTIEIKNFTKQRVFPKSLREAADYAARKWRLSGELSLVLAGDKRLRSLNRNYRRKDKPTDILTFPAPKESIGQLGEIVINLDDCARPVRYLDVFPEKKPFEYLLLFLLLHGLLHLAGYEDEKESGRLLMVSKGRKMMEELVKNGIIKVK